MAPRVGVLSLQGDFACHRSSLEALGAEAVRVVLPEHLTGIDALVMPGGESTTMLRLMESNGLRKPLDAFVRARPVLGTCAGVILLGRGGERLPFPPLGALDVEVERNAYGRQIDSFSADVDSPVVGGGYHGVFIRAPRIRSVGNEVDVIATLPGPGGSRDPVGVRQRNVVGLCFHPELTTDLRFHRWFLERVAGLSLPAGEPADASSSHPAGAEPA